MNISSTIYNGFMFPLEKLRLKSLRKELIGHAYGEVLELGVGTGANLPHYNFEKVSRLVATDLVLKKEEISYHPSVPDKVRWMECGVEQLPFPDETLDTVVMTLVFCSVLEPAAGLAEIRRVLKSGGRLIFLEHILPKGSGENHIFHKLDGGWSRIAGGCHLNRETPALIKAAGFSMEQEEHFLKGIFTWGIAKK